MAGENINDTMQSTDASAANTEQNVPDQNETLANGTVNHTDTPAAAAAEPAAADANQSISFSQQNGNGATINEKDAAAAETGEPLQQSRTIAFGEAPTIKREKTVGKDEARVVPVRKAPKKGEKTEEKNVDIVSGLGGRMKYSLRSDLVSKLTFRTNIPSHRKKSQKGIILTSTSQIHQNHTDSLQLGPQSVLPRMVQIF